jgi:hypothetical protein
VNETTHEINGKYRSIKFDGKSVTITLATGTALLPGELRNRFRLSQIQAIEHKPPTWGAQGKVTFRLSGYAPGVTRVNPMVMASDLPPNVFPYPKKDRAEVEALVEAIEEAMYD